VRVLDQDADSILVIHACAWTVEYPEIPAYLLISAWRPPDSQNHNAAAAEHGWARKLELLKKALS
jgi:hypothetical protein